MPAGHHRAGGDLDGGAVRRSAAAARAAGQHPADDPPRRRARAPPSRRRWRWGRRAGRSAVASGSARVRPSASASGTADGGERGGQAAAYARRARLVPAGRRAARPSSIAAAACLRAHPAEPIARARRACRPAVVAAAELVDGVAQDRPEHGEAVLGAAGRAGQVDHQRPAGHPGQTRGRAPRSGPCPGCAPGSPRRCRGSRSRAAPGSPPGVRSVGRDAGAAAGQHHVDAVREGRPQRLGAPARRPAPRPARRPRSRARAGRRPAAGRWCRRTRRPRPGWRRRSTRARITAGPPGAPTRRSCRPPCAAPGRRRSLAAGSTALTMSISARPATATAVSASISTPVRSAVLAVAVISTRVVGEVQVDGDAVQGDRVAERDEVRGALGAHDAGEPGDGERVALGQAVAGAAGRGPRRVVRTGRRRRRAGR